MLFLNYLNSQDDKNNNDDNKNFNLDRKKLIYQNQK